ncbi:tRNA (32-2'-O)-methyltransferase regulator THADA-like isoform X2 [Tachypleus tridentatus]|uniref:tRNA (32-2'-O)-methyltransferase regulator THADA-like isoform X2 n=1 Tax=Tachypleus tridentatus TaxID=6853 RepID=UPI003FD1480A
MMCKDLISIYKQLLEQNVSEKKIQNILRVFLQQIQTPMLLKYETNPYTLKLFWDFAKLFIEFIQKKDTLVENSLLSASCLVSLLCQIMHPEGTAEFLVYVLIRLSDIGLLSNEKRLLPDFFFKDKRMKGNLSSETEGCSPHNCNENCETEGCSPHKCNKNCETEGCSPHKCNENCETEGCSPHKCNKNCETEGCLPHKCNKNCETEGCSPHKCNKNCETEGCSPHKCNENLETEGCSPHKCNENCSDPKMFITSLFDELYFDEEQVKTRSLLDTVKPSFSHLAVLHGLLTTRQKDHLLCKVKSHSTLLFDIYFLIHKLCLMSSTFQFHAFHLFLNWIKIVKSLLPELYVSVGLVETRIVSQKSALFKDVLQTIFSNWESPVRGVSEIVKNIFKNVLEAHEIENKLCDDESSDFLVYIFQRVDNMSWDRRGKYSVFEKHLDLPSYVIRSFVSNYLVSSSCDIYRQTVEHMLVEGEALCQWARWWLPEILTNLMGSCRVKQQGVVNHLLPWTLKVLPASYSLLKEGVKGQSLYAEVTLARIARQSGVCSFNDISQDLVLKSLAHIDENVRIEAVMLVCTSQKKSELPSLLEIEKLKDFLSDNLNIDSGPFRCQLFKHVTTFLVRIRDGALSLLGFKKQNSFTNIPPVLWENICFVDWLLDLITRNLIPGSSFQRRHSCLSIYLVTMETFCSEPNPQRKKGVPPAKTHLLVQFVQSNGNWNFFTVPILYTIMTCMMDRVDEIKELAVKILEDYFLWPPPDGSLHSLNEDMLASALRLCNSPHVQECDTGAFIHRLLFIRCVVRSKMQISWTHKIILTGTLDSNPELDYLTELLRMAEEQFSLAENNLLKAASNTPVHGILHALHRVMTDKPEALSHLLESIPGDELTLIKMQHLMTNVFDLCDNIVKLMLEAMGSGSDVSKEVAPSFEEMGISLQNVAHKFRENQILEDDPALPHDYQLLISCCWQSIKESCFFLADLITVMFTEHPKLKHFIDHALVQKAVNCMVSVLMRCRHKGAIEACSSALHQVCASLLKSSDINLAALPQKTLEKVYVGIMKTAVNCSTTRRSAGISLLVQAVVTSEPDSQHHKLLDYTLHELFKIIRYPLPVSVNQCADLPQAQALHILRELVSNANLSKHILTFLDEIIPACIDGFSSPSWGVRNGALQLYGAAVSRLLGQKKGVDSERSVGSAGDVFSRYPRLHDYLLSTLQHAITSHHQGSLHPSLVPLLTFLSRFSADQGFQENQYSQVSQFIPLLQRLLESPVWTIRSVSASALVSLLPQDDIPEMFLALVTGLSKAGEYFANRDHGYLLTLWNILKTRNVPGQLFNLDSNVEETCLCLSTLHRCTIVQTLSLAVLQLFSERVRGSGVMNSPNNTILRNADESTLCKWTPGYSLWCRAKLEHRLKNTKPEELDIVVSEEVARNIINEDCLTCCLDFLDEILKQQSAVDGDQQKLISIYTWKKIMETLTWYVTQTHPSMVVRVLNLINIMCGTLGTWNFRKQLVENKQIDLFLNRAVTGCYGTSVCAASLELMSLRLKLLLQFQPESLDLEAVIKWASLICLSCQPVHSEDTRHTAAVCLHHAGVLVMQHLVTVSKKNNRALQVLINLCEGILILLQEESGDVK